MNTKTKILGYGQETFWGASRSGGMARVKQSIFPTGHAFTGRTPHEFLERTTWHSGQHVRQLVMVRGMLGIAPNRPPSKETFAGLPMPDKIWDDERPMYPD